MNNLFEKHGLEGSIYFVKDPFGVFNNFVNVALAEDKDFLYFVRPSSMNGVDGPVNSYSVTPISKELCIKAIDTQNEFFRNYTSKTKLPNLKRGIDVEEKLNIADYLRYFEEEFYEGAKQTTALKNIMVLSAEDPDQANSPSFVRFAPRGSGLGENLSLRFTCVIETDSSISVSAVKSIVDNLLCTNIFHRWDKSLAYRFSVPFKGKEGRRIHTFTITGQLLNEKIRAIGGDKMMEFLREERDYVRHFESLVPSEGSEEFMRFNEELRKLRLSYELMKRKIDKMMIVRDEYRTHLEFKQAYDRIDEVQKRIDELNKTYSDLSLPLNPTLIQKQILIKKSRFNRSQSQFISNIIPTSKKTGNLKTIMKSGGCANLLKINIDNKVKESILKSSEKNRRKEFFLNDGKTITEASSSLILDPPSFILGNVSHGGRIEVGHDRGIDSDPRDVILETFRDELPGQGTTSWTNSSYYTYAPSEDEMMGGSDVTDELAEL